MGHPTDPEFVTRIDDALISSLVEARSTTGYLSLYECVDHADPNAWRTHARTKLKNLAATSGGSRARRQRIVLAVDRALAAIESLPVAAARFRSIAGFLDVDVADHDLWVAFDMVTEPSVTLGRRPRIAPLLALHDLGSATGVLECTNESIVLVEWHHGSLRPVDRVQADADLEARPKVGPASATPGRMRESSVQRDLFERGVHANVLNQLVEWTARNVPRQARERGWQRIVVFGPAEAEHKIRGVLPSNVLVIHGDAAIVVNEPVRKVRDRVESVLHEHIKAREESVVDNVVGGAAPNAVVGRPQTEHALDAQRVAQLVVPEFPSSAATGLNGASAVEEMIRAAVEQQAEVILVHDDASDRLQRSGGAAALLRY